MALGYVPGRPATANQHQINNTKRQEQNDCHVFTFLHTGNNKSLAARPEQQGIICRSTSINHLLYIAVGFT